MGGRTMRHNHPPRSWTNRRHCFNKFIPHYPTRSNTMASRFLIRAMAQAGKQRTSLARVASASFTSTAPTHAQKAAKDKASDKLKKMIKTDILNTRFIIPEGASLPFSFKKGNVGIRLEYVGEERAERAFDVLTQTISGGDGLCPEDVPSWKEFKHLIRNERRTFAVIHEEDDDIISVLIVKDSPVARSEKTIHFAGPVCNNPKYRNQGFGKELLTMVTIELGRLILKHPGFPCARTVLTKNVGTILGTGVNLTAIIPKATYLEKYGWVNDLVMNVISPHRFSEALKQLPAPALSPLIISKEVPTEMQSDKPPITDFPPLKINGHTLNVELASDDDVWRVEEILRTSALQSDGFFIDEFNHDGRYNRKMLHDSHVVVLKTADNIIAGCSIFGPTSLSRTYNPEQVGGFIHIQQEFRQKGLGQAFLKYMMSLASEAGYEAILTDVIASNSAARNLLNNNDFMVTGTVPHSGYLLNKGYTHTNLCWREL